MSDCRNMRLRWERVSDTHHLHATSPADVDTDSLEQLLAKVAQDDPGYDKPFSTEAVAHFDAWFHQLRQAPEHNRLREEAYCLLSNWFLTGEKGLSFDAMERLVAALGLGVVIRPKTARKRAKRKVKHGKRD